jgi:hypothetical protein
MTTRSRISGEYFLFIVFHPCLKNGTKVKPIQVRAGLERCRTGCLCANRPGRGGPIRSDEHVYPVSFMAATGHHALPVFVSCPPKIPTCGAPPSSVASR